MRLYSNSRPIAQRRAAKPQAKPDARALRRAKSSNSNTVMLSVSVIILIAVLIAMGYLSQRSALISAYSNLEAIEERIGGLKQLCNEKAMELSRLTSVASVEKAAREKLGMVDATKVAVLMIEKPEAVVAEAQDVPAETETGLVRLNIEVPTVLAIFGSWLKSTAITATSSMISTWHANSNGSLPDILQ